MTNAWSDEENRALVDAYFAMLETLMTGEHVVKSQVRNSLRNGVLFARSDGSIEFKMQNASAALFEEGYPWVDGYKPHSNYQQSLGDMVRDVAKERKILRTSFNQAHRQFADALDGAGLVFDNDFVRAFLASLATKRFVILTGLSGSGKTQIALKFGEWLGDERYAVIPVRPDWTGAEALFGYENALTPLSEDGRRGWHVPDALEFMLRAVNDPYHPYLLILDEMNLAHVERYFADALSGMESGFPVLPNLVCEDGIWRIKAEAPEKVKIPDNLFIVGTVNVDETTYMFSPKVLDRANTMEFRVQTEQLVLAATKPGVCEAGPVELLRGFLSISQHPAWSTEEPPAWLEPFVQHMRALHALLSEAGFEFGHRVFYEAVRFAAIYDKEEETEVTAALDRQILQKLLPRLHGSRRRLESTLCALGRYCWTQDVEPGAIFDGRALSFDPISHNPSEAALPLSADKIRRMTRSLRANQFASFTE